MDGILGLLRIRVIKGINLAVRDTVSSDPYVVLTMKDQKLKTHVVKNNINPEWNDDLTLSMKTLDEPITLTVYDKDTFSGDDKMGEATIDIQPYIKALRMGMTNLPNGCALARVQPNEHNCLADESSVVWNNGEVTQQMRLALKNVECGELVVQLLWIECPGCKGLGTSSKGSPLHNRDFSFSG